MTVSYTHLDVYKRQTLILAGDVGRGDTILIDVKDGKLTAGVKK